MSVKIKVSYEHPEELLRIKEKLKKDISRIKEPNRQEGKYKKAYIELKTMVK